MPKPPGARSRIAEAALQLFSRDGLAATTVRGIIREAGVNLNSLHYHYGSKGSLARELVREIMEPINAERSALMAETAAEPDVARLLRALYWPVFHRAVAPPESRSRQQMLFISHLRHDASAEAAAILSENQGVFAPQFERLMERACGAPEPAFRLPVRFINAMMWGVATQPTLIDDLLAGEAREERSRAVFADLTAFAICGLSQHLSRQGETR